MMPISLYESLGVEDYPSDEDILQIFLGRGLYGIDVLERVNINREVKLKLIDIQPIIIRLERSGFLRVRPGRRLKEAGGIPRKMYSISWKGLIALGCCFD
jgi:DNA-binding PadR family transcriptional regulator